MAEAGIKLSVDGAAGDAATSFQQRFNEVVSDEFQTLERAYPRAMSKGVTQPGKKALRSTIEATGFYRAAALAKTWRGYTYGAAPPSLEPAAFFKTRAAMIVNAFEDGAVIAVKDAQYLAIPVGPAKAIIHALNRGRTSEGALRNEANPVQRVAAALGVSLIPIISVDGDHGVLVPDDLSTLTKGGRRTKANRGAPTALFALVKSAKLGKRPMGRAVLAGIAAAFEANFAAALANELGEDA